MKTLLTVLKWSGIVLGSLIVVLVIAVYAMQNKQFDAPYPDIRASSDSAVIARGKYLAFGSAHCGGCHAAIRDSAAVMNGEVVDLSGGREFVLPFGSVHVRNITNDKETGIGRLTDQEIARTLRYGVGSDGRAVFDFMSFYNASDEDLTAIISYLRSTKPVKNTVPEHSFNFIGKAIKAFAIKPMGSLTETRPKTNSPGPTEKYGEYLANSVANCRGCHTDRDLKTGDYIGEYYSGGFKMPSETNPQELIVSPNLTPDKETGHIRDWTFESFYARFQSGAQPSGSPMPWMMFKHMSEDDMRAIWNYLHTLKPVKKDVGPLRVAAE